MLALTLLLLLATTAMRSAMDKYNSTSQAASWQEALYAAEAGVDLARAALKNARNNPAANPWAGWTPSDMTFPKTRTITLDTLSNSSWTNADTTRPWGATARVEVLRPVSTGINPPGSPDICYQIRSYGTVIVSGGAPRITEGSVEAGLRKIYWRRDSRTGLEVNNSTNRPHVTRMVEALVRPVSPFAAAIISSDKIEIKKQGGARMVIDSYNSKLGKYDPNKRGTVFTGTPPGIANSGYGGTLATNGKRKDVIRLENVDVYGEIYKNTGGTVNQKSTATVSGSIHDGFYMDLIQANSPSGDPLWGTLTGTYNLKPGAKTVNIQLPASSTDPTTPARYKFTNLHLHDKDIVTIKTPNSAVTSYAEIWVTSSVRLHKNARFNLEKGVKVKFFVQRCVHLESKSASEPPIQFQGNPAKEDSFVPDSSGKQSNHLPEFYGVLPDKKKKSHVKIKGMIAALFHAPRHDFEIKVSDKANADIYGAFIGKSFKIQGVARIHYDEGVNTGPVSDYAIASWTEDWFDPNSAK
jgi:hypothetical protein